MSETYTHKEIPLEALDNLPDGYCVLAWGCEWLFERGPFSDGRSWSANMPKWDDGCGREWKFAGGAANILYAAPQDSDVAKACRSGREMTVWEWLKTLPNGYRGRAMANSGTVEREETSDQLYEALDLMTNWDMTPEGEDFWYYVMLWANGQCQLPPLPDTPAKEPEPTVPKSETVESPWISVKDRLPHKENGRETGNVMVRGHNPDIGRDYTQIRSWRHVGPGSWYSHWMPIPALPSLPVDPAQEAFDAWYEPAQSKHRKEQQEAFIAGFRAKEGGQA